MSSISPEDHSSPTHIARNVIANETSSTEIQIGRKIDKFNCSAMIEYSSSYKNTSRLAKGDTWLFLSNPIQSILIFNKQLESTKVAK